MEFEEYTGFNHILHFTDVPQDTIKSVSSKRKNEIAPTKFIGAKVIFFLVRGIVEYLESHQQKNNSRI